MKREFPLFGLLLPVPILAAAAQPNITAARGGHDSALIQFLCTLQHRDGHHCRSPAISP